MRVTSANDAVTPHDHSDPANGGQLSVRALALGSNIARLDSAAPQTFSGDLAIEGTLTCEGASFTGAVELDDLNTTPVQTVIGAFISTIGAEAVTDARNWKFPDRPGAADVVPLEARHRALVTKTGAYTLTEADDIVLGNATGAAFTLTLPTAVGIAGRIYQAKKIDASVNAVTVDGNAAETIDGAATYALALQYQSVTVVSNGANWLVL